MKKVLLIAAALLFSSVASFADDRFYTEASELTLTGKVFQNTPNPYQRMDFTKYGSWTDKDVDLLEMSTFWRCLRESSFHSRPIPQRFT